MIQHLTVAVPKNVISRDGIDPKTLENFERVTGIKKTRRWDGGSTSLAIEAVRAAKPALEEVIPYINSVVFVTQSPERLSPCVAMEVHRELGLAPIAMAFDVNQSCCGFIYGLDMARTLATRGLYRCFSLVVCVDTLRFGEGVESLIFSDAASVALVAPDHLFYKYLTDPSGADKLFCTTGGKMCMNGGDVQDFVNSNIPDFINKYETDVATSDFLCGHQSNKAMMRTIEWRTGFTGRSLHSIEEYGNASMVSIPIALAHNEETILGKSVLLCGYGAGWAAAAVRIRWSASKVSQIVEV